MKNRIKQCYLLLITAIISFSCNDPEREEDPCLMEECMDFATIDFEPAWSPDGQWIAYTHFRSIYLIRPDGTDNTLWHEGGEMPEWSPDGLWIAFGQNAQIWKKKLDGENLTQLTFEGRNFYPDWSPDGNLIAYVQSVSILLKQNSLFRMK